MVEKRVPQETVSSRSIVTPAAAGVPCIRAISGPATGRALAMTRVRATVGRHATNDLVLTDPRVSGVHLELRRGPEGRVHVRDAGSTNGTWLGAHRIADAELAAGAHITVGDTVLAVTDDPSASPVALSASASFGELVGQSPAMRETFTTLERVAKRNLTILFEGEPGTGKEEMARAVVARSLRAEHPFLTIDVTSLPEAYVDIALFGEESPGQPEPRRGLFESADRGTVFIDQVGALPIATQSKLLRLLERREFVRVGGHIARTADVRVLASSTRDLRHGIEQKTFREDLYLRLAQVRIEAPPLRDRLEDLPALCQKILGTIGGETALRIEDEALRELAEHPWPGNVRELRNALERAAALTADDVVRKTAIAGEGFGFRGTARERSALDLSGTFKTAKERAVERFEAAYLAALMRRCNGNVSLASREADLARHHLRDLLKKRELYGISWDGEGE